MPRWRWPGRSFTALQLGARLDHAFSTRSDLLLFDRYDNEDHKAAYDVRCHWIPTVGDDIYVMWNSSHTTDPE